MTTQVGDDALRFPSLDSLRAAHTDLLRRQRESTNGALTAEIEAFIRRGAASGVLLDAEADRQQAQSTLDYWSTRLFRPDYEPPDSTLADFDPALAPELDDALCPYLGLDAFGEQRSAVFFGRERLIRELTDKLRAERLLAVLGPSGSGKSSVVRAGLLPALKHGALPTSEGWTYLPPIVPGSSPLHNLARLLESSHAERFRHKPDQLATEFERFGGPVVVVVDQFEEVFALCTDDEARRAFVDNLVALLRSPAEHRVILTLRSDFEPLVGRLPDFQPLFEQAVVRVTPLSAAELREAILAPANRIGLKFEAGVVEALLNDILGEPAALPLLQFTLLKLWERRERNRITWEAYKKLGGGRQALARAADEFYNDLIPEEQTTARRLLLKLVRPGDGAEFTSNRVRRAELYHKADAADRVDRVLEKFIRARLLRVTEGERPEDAQVEVAHEALVRNWPTLVGWLEDERVTLRQRQRLTTGADQWQRLGKDPSALRRGVLLQESLRYDDLNPLEAEFVQAGVAAEQAAEAERDAQRERELTAARQLAEEQKRAAERQRRWAQRLALVSVLAVLFAIAAAVFGFQSIQERVIAEGARIGSDILRVTAEAASTEAVAQQLSAETARAEGDGLRAIAEAASTQIAEQRDLIERESLSRQLASQSASLFDRQLDLASLLAVEAYRVSDTVEARGNLLDVMRFNPRLRTYLDSHTARIAAVVFSPQAEIMASASGGTAEVFLWDFTDPNRPALINQLPVASGAASLAFSPDGGTLVTAGGEIVVWDVSDPARPNKERTLSGHTAWVRSVAFSADGRWLASGGEDLIVRVWDAATGLQLGQPLTLPEAVNSVAFSANGRVLAATVADGQVYLWDVGDISTPRFSGGYDAGIGPLWNVAFSPIQDVLVATGDTQGMVVWDVSNADAPQIISRANSNSQFGTTSLAFSPDGQRLVTGKFNQTAIVWDVSDPAQPKELYTLTRHVGSSFAVFAAAFSRDGNTLVTGSDDLMVWNTAPDPAPEIVLKRYEQRAPTVAFGAGGRLLAAEGDDEVDLWTVSPAAAPLPLTSLPINFVTALAFTADDDVLAVGDGYGQIHLWAASGIAEPTPLTTFPAHQAGVSALAFSPDGTRLASGDDSGDIRLWAVSDPANPRELPDTMQVQHSAGVADLAFSPDGQVLASSDWAGDVLSWNVQQATSFALPRSNLWVVGVTFSPDGKWLAHSGSIISIYSDISQPEFERVTVLGAHTSSLAFSPGGQVLASGGGQSELSVSLWDVATWRPLGRPLRQPANIHSLAFSPDGQALALGYAPNTQAVAWLPNMSVGAWVAEACRRAGRNLSVAEWLQYFDNAYHQTCPEFPPGE